MAPSTEEIRHRLGEFAAKWGGRYPKGAVFVDAEAPFAGSALVRDARKGLPVVRVYSDGVEKIIEATSPTAERTGIVATARRLVGKLRTSRRLG